MSNTHHGEPPTLPIVLAQVQHRLDAAAQSSINASVGPNKSNKWDWGETVEKLREASDDLKYWSNSVNVREISAHNEAECERICGVLDEVSELLRHCEFVLGLSREVSPNALRHDCFSALCYKIHGLRYPHNSLDGLANHLAHSPLAASAPSPTIQSSPLLASASPASPSASSNPASPASYDTAPAYTRHQYLPDLAGLGEGEPSQFRKDSNVALPTIWQASDSASWRTTLPSFANLRHSTLVTDTHFGPTVHHHPTLPLPVQRQDAPPTVSLGSPPFPHRASTSCPSSERLEWDSRTYAPSLSTPPPPAILPRTLQPPLTSDGPITPQPEVHFRTAASEWVERRSCGNAPGPARPS